MTKVVWTDFKSDHSDTRQHWHILFRYGWYIPLCYRWLISFRYDWHISFRCGWHIDSVAISSPVDRISVYTSIIYADLCSVENIITEFKEKAILYLIIYIQKWKKK